MERPWRKTSGRQRKGTKEKQESELKKKKKTVAKDKLKHKEEARERQSGSVGAFQAFVLLSLKANTLTKAN